MRIIAFSGKKQSGKTTAVTSIVNKIQKTNRWREISFMAGLKFIVQSCFGATQSNLYGTEDEKNELLPCGKSTRELLQIIGTDWFRSLDPDCWVNSYKMTISETSPDTIIVTPDVRFPNEVKCIQDLGGHVIRLLRSPYDDQHESETALDTIELCSKGVLNKHWDSTNQHLRCIRHGLDHFDAIIDNRKMDIPTQNEAVWKLVNDRGWI